MNWSRRYAIRSYLRSTVWTAPVIALVLEQITFRVAYFHGIDFGGIPGFVIGKSGTIALADYVIGSSISFIVFTFSSLIVAIQVASGQLSPRIIATTLLRDRGIRGSVALFVYALLLAIAVKTRIDTIPRFLTSVTGILGLLSVIVFMFLIDHAARLLRPVNIVGRVAQQGLQVLEEVYPNPIATSPAPPRDLKNLTDATRIVFHEDRSAIIIAVNVNALISSAAKADAVVEMIPRVGDFVATGDPLFRLRGGREKEIDERFLRGQVAFGRERTIEQDSTFAFRVIVDIAIKALSPAINDPTTAVIAIDQLQRLLRSVGRRDLRDEGMLDNQGQLRLIFHTPNWNDFVDLTFSEIRMYGTTNLQVVRRLRSMIRELLQNLPERRRELLHGELDLLDRSIARVYVLPEDLTRARIADSQGLGGASGNAVELS
ncbi:MAG: DUF2254 domain-containing protein [Deltaproteobacteria bacterium]|nr:DUF2254 domain-containing protein [Deltaproteobacteria bacterium]